MLKVQENITINKNYILPVPYISSIEHENTGVNFTIVLTDKENTWLTNQQILQDTQLIIKINNEKYTYSLLEVKNSVIIKNNTIKKIFFLPIKGQDVIVETYTENQFSVSDTVKESVLINGLVPKINFNNISYEYFNKTKDLKLLSKELINEKIFNDALEIIEPNRVNKIASNRLYISYTTDKKGNIGFIFNITKFLEVYSNTYKFLKKSDKFRKEIIKNSKINIENSSFYKKNISLKNTQYEEIVPIFARRMDANKYFITATDLNSNKADKSQYSIKVKIEIENYSDKLFSSMIRESLSKCVADIKNYKNYFEQVIKNNLIQDPNKFIFENYWQEGSNIKNIEEIINTLVDVTGVYADNEMLPQYTSLFTSLLHPLTTDLNLLERLLQYVLKLQTVTNQIQSTFSLPTSTINETVLFGKISFEKEFDVRDPFNILNYDYDQNYGYEVISVNAFNARQSETYEGLKVITKDGLNIRRRLEGNKYFVSPNQSSVDTYRTFSISFVDAGVRSYDFITNVSSVPVDDYNNLFLKLNEYNDFNFQYPTLESFFYQLAEKNVLVKSISQRQNISSNGLQKSTLFDPNLDSKQDSLEFITSTGVKNLYYYLNDYKYDYNEQQTVQFSASLNLNPNLTSTFIVSGSNITNIDFRPKAIAFYNSIYEESIPQEGAGTYYNLVWLKEKQVNSLFKKKLKFFNEYYLYLVKQPPTQVEKPDFIDLQKDLLFNNNPTYINNTKTDGKFMVSIEEL